MAALAETPTKTPTVQDALARGLAQLRLHLESLVDAGEALADQQAATRAGEPRFDLGTPLSTLCDRLDLTASEATILSLLLAHELDPRARELLRELNSERLSDPTADTLRRIAYSTPWSAAAQRELSPSAPLQRLGLITRTDAEPSCPAHRQTFAVAPRVVLWALGEGGLDPVVAPLATIDASGAELDELTALVVDPAVVAELDRALASETGLVVLCGQAGTGRRSLLRALARERGLEPLEIDCHALPIDRVAAEQALRALARECRLLGRVPLLRNLDALARTGEGVDRADRLDLVEALLSGVVLATARSLPARRWQRPPRVVPMPSPTSTERATLWSRAIPQASAADAQVMATMFPLAPALVRAAAAHAHRQAAHQALAASHIADGVAAVVDARLAGLATRIHTSQSWDDLVLPADQATALRELIARVRRRHTVYEEWGFGDKVGKGLGIAALLSGPPGTGKTMAAALVAKELGAPLYQVDLSKIVSKWIGETERNLAALFDAAESAHAILLFDEADSLFGKRTEVKSSNDRHANQEVNFLLQRMESHSGVCLLTTNHENALDEAFRRRLSVHVRLALPEADEREKLWRALLPAKAPVAAALPLRSLAESFAMSGGYIKNAVLRAAFLAADASAPIDGALLTRAAHLEYEAMGKLAPTPWSAQ